MMNTNRFKFFAGRNGAVRGVDVRATKMVDVSGEPKMLVEVLRGGQVVASGETQAFIWDCDVSGFGVRYTATRATYVFQGRIKGSGKYRRVSIGKCNLLKLDEARDLAKDKEREFARGYDEAARRAADDLATFTIGEAFDLYVGKLEGFEAHGKRLKPRTIADVEACQSSIRDWLDRPVRQLTGREVVERHAKLGSRSKARANLVFRYLRAAINHADNELSPEPGEGDPLVDRNPVDRLSRGKKWFKVERRRSRIAKFSEWWSALDRLSGSGRFGDAAADYFRFIALTGCRPSEAFDLTWECVDLIAGTFTLKNTKNGNDLTLPTGPFLLAVLAGRRKVSGRHFVFSNPEGERPACPRETDQPFRNQIRKVRVESGVQFMPTDLRREVASTLTSMRYGPDVVKIVLNHTSRTTTDVTAGYIHLDELHLREVMVDLESAILTKARVAYVTKRLNTNT